jgi:hypothetical protein
MTDPTDSELRDRFETNQTEISALRGKTTAASKARLKLLREDQRRIGLQWNELFVRKRQGALTDRNYIDQLIKTTREVSMLHGIRLEFEEREGPRDADQIADYWILIAKCKGSPTECTDARMRRLAMEITREFRTDVGDVLHGHGDSELEDQDRPDADFFEVHVLTLYDSDDNVSDGPMSIFWSVDAWPWDGPGQPFSVRDLDKPIDED